MNKKMRESLERAGYVFGDADDFLGLTEEESRLIDIRLAVSRAVRNARLAKKLTQAQAAKILETSQPNVSNIEMAAADVTLDLMYRSLIRLGGTAVDVQVELPKARVKSGQKPRRHALDRGFVGAAQPSAAMAKPAKASRHGIHVSKSKAKKGKTG